VLTQATEGVTFDLQMDVDGWVPLDVPGGIYRVSPGALEARGARQFFMLGRMALREHLRHSIIAGVLEKDSRLMSLSRKPLFIVQNILQLVGI